MIYLDRATELFIESQSPHYLRDFILLNKTRAHIMKNEMHEGIKFLKESEELTEYSENIFGKLKIYKELQNYYRQVQDTANLYLYLEKHTELQNYLNVQKIQPVILQLESLRAEKDALTQTNKIFRSVALILITIFIVGIIVFYYRKRRTHQKFQQIISELERNVGKDRIIQKSEKLASSEPNQKQKFQIPEKTHQKILDDLRKFKESDAYLQSNISLADMASQFNVNAKYISHVLNHDLGKDFNKFINECRIHYILDRLHTVREYRLYKLSVLAEKCGFSSHSKFTAIFKSVTGITPSAFIKYLKQEEQNQTKRKFK